MMNFEQARGNMIEQQIRTWEVLDQEVLDLLLTVKREDFVPPAYRELAFADVEIPLGHGAAMLEPKIEARVLQALQLKKSAKVLEIGSGSGYMTALLATQAAHVYSVEIVPELVAMACANLQRAGIANVTIETGDGAHGWPSHAPYDAIFISAATPVLPREFLRQLKPGGRLIAFTGESPVVEAQLITQITDGVFDTVNLFETDIAPLVNAAQPERFVF